MYSLSLFFLALFTLFIAAHGFFRWDSAFLREGNIPAIQFLVILIAVFFLFYGLYLLFYWLRNRPTVSKRRICLGLLALILVGQLAFLLYFQPTLRHDALKTFDQAVEMLSTHTISESYEGGYFARYTNNYPITILTYWILSLLSALGLPASQYMLALQLFNVVLLDISLLLGCGILRTIQRDSDNLLLYLLLCAVCPGTYVWSGFYYTSTLSMPFLMGILLLFVQMRKRGGLPLPVQAFLLGFLSLMGYKFRATALIALIAIGIAACYPRPSLRILRRRGREFLLSAASFVLACALVLGFWSAAVSRYVDFDYKNTGFPTIHWVMMGMRWDGAYDQSDELYTFSFPTKEEKISADMELLTKRIQEAGPGGMLSLMGRKLLNTWVDGTDTYEAENNLCRYGKLYEYLLGNKDGLLVIYAQAFRVLQMLILGISSILLLWFRWRHGQQHREPSLFFVLQLTLLGGMAFHLIWETNPLYSIGFHFLALLLMGELLSSLWSAAKADKLLSRTGKILSPICLLCLAALLLLGKKQLVETPIEENLFRIHQYQYNTQNRTYVQDYEETYTQTFTTDQPFNRLAIYAVNTVGPYNQSAFRVSITDDQGHIIYQDDRFLSGMVVKNEWYAFPFDLVTPNGPTTYTVSFSPGYIHGEDSLQFLYYHTGNEDLYPQGQLTIGGKEQKNGDLAFAVYEYQVTTYFNWKVYLLLSMLFIAGGGAVTVGVWRFRK